MGHRLQDTQTVWSAWAAIPPPPDIIHKQGACVGQPQALFFSDTPSSKVDAEAKSFCKGCPVRQPCLEYALKLPWGVDFGVWGGTNRNERKAIRNGRKQQPRRP